MVIHSSKSLIIILLLIISIFAVLDGLRDTFFMGSFFSYLKEFAVCFLFLVIIFINKNNLIFPIKYYLYNLILIIPLIFCFLNTFFLDFDFGRSAELNFGGGSVLIKLLIGFFLFNALCFFKINYRNIYGKIPFYYIYSAVFYCVITMVFIIFGFDQYLEMRNWYGRLSIGYPPMDCFVLSCAIVFSLYYINNKIKKSIFILLFILVILMQNTATGYLLLGTFFFFMFFFISWKFKILALISIFMLSAFLFYVYLYLAADWGTFGSLIIYKIDGFLFNDNENFSVVLRSQQIDLLLDILTSQVFYYIFGLGGEGGFLVENHYYALFGLYGVFGIILYSFLYCSLLTDFIKKIKKNRNKQVNFFLLTLYFVGGLSLFNLYLFPFIFIFSYIMTNSVFPEKGESI